MNVFWFYFASTFVVFGLGIYMGIMIADVRQLKKTMRENTDNEINTGG